MKVIWKRPDGFHGASPLDFIVVQVGQDATIWLHKTDHDTYPFRVAGGWEEEDQSKKLNNFINLIHQSPSHMTRHLVQTFSNILEDEKPQKFINDLYAWLDELVKNLKGDKWELDIMAQVLNSVRQKISACEKDFLVQV